MVRCCIVLCFVLLSGVLRCGVAWFWFKFDNKNSGLLLIFVGEKILSVVWFGLVLNL